MGGDFHGAAIKNSDHDYNRACVRHLLIAKTPPMVHPHGLTLCRYFHRLLCVIPLFAKANSKWELSATVSRRAVFVNPLPTTSVSLVRSAQLFPRARTQQTLSDFSTGDSIGHDHDLLTWLTISIEKSKY
ncbi:hypothetical protein BHE74_00045922 [Ensete ventricosum]|nr:hypothetical protein BHE74_00045922 [Ensete ventricosum]